MPETTVAAVREIGDITTDSVSLRDPVEKAASVLRLQLVYNEGTRLNTKSRNPLLFLL